MCRDKLLCHALGVALALITLSGCGSMQGSVSSTPLRTSAPPFRTLTPTLVRAPTATLAPMSIRGRLLDIQGNPIAGVPVVLCHEREGLAGVAVEPVPQDLEAKSGPWWAATDDQGTFVLGPSAGQPEIHASSQVPGGRYTLAVGITPRSGAFDQACSPYVLLGAVYVRESCSDGYRPDATEILWLTLTEGETLDLGIITYLEAEQPPCCGYAHE